MAVEVPLTRGRVALVSEEDAQRVLLHKWTHHSQGYAYRQVKVEGKYVPIMMHRFILDLPGQGKSGLYVDHINGDRLDNRRENLRVVTNAQNQMAARNRGVSTGFRGVEQLTSGRFRAYIHLDGRKVRVGPVHETVEDAAREYDLAALQHYGEFAFTNFPLESYR